MAALRLLTSDDCHLCEHSKQVLEELAAEGLLAWHEVAADGEEGERLAVAAPPLRPVLFAPNGAVIAYGRLSARRLRKQLARG